MPDNELDDHGLLERDGLPDDLRFLLERYPRGEWEAHANLQGMASFWLQRHNMFRELGGLLTNAIAEYREGRTTPRDFAQFFAPRLNFFLSNLDGHHRIEDDVYFPTFARAESRLKRGFDILDADHHLIHEALKLNADTANMFLQALDADRDRQRFAADAYGAANEQLIQMLARHLDDEEDLIIPLILDRGDSMFGG